MNQISTFGSQLWLKKVQLVAAGDISCQIGTWIENRELCSMDEPLTLLEVRGASLIGMLLTEAILQDVSLIGLHLS